MGNYSVLVMITGLPPGNGNMLIEVGAVLALNNQVVDR